MSAALGRLPNAPLAYVLAQVRFEPFLEIEKCIPALQTHLRDRYPRFRRFERVGFEVVTDEKQPPRVQPAGLVHWEFGTATHVEGIVVQQDSLVFHVTAYETHEQFGQAWQWVMNRVGEQLPRLFVNRIGLRYIDFIVPKVDELPEDYVVDRLRCDPEPGISSQSHRGLTAAEYRLDGDRGYLAVRYSRGTGQPRLPPDLVDLSLRPSAIMQQTVDEKQPTAVLDIDRYMALSATYDADALAEQFRQMHGETSTVFKALTTDYARMVWNGVPPA